MHRRGDKVALSVKEIKRLYCVEGHDKTKHKENEYAEIFKEVINQ